MDKNIIKRVIKEADILLNSKITIREIARLCNVSKSTVHKDLNERLLEIDKVKYLKIKDIFKEHIAIRHIKGGESTRLKYLKSL